MTTPLPPPPWATRSTSEEGGGYSPEGAYELRAAIDAFLATLADDQTDHLPDLVQRLNSALDASGELVDAARPLIRMATPATDCPVAKDH